MTDGPDIRFELTRPDVRLRDAWLAAYAEWPAGSHLDGTGLREGDDVHSPDGFAAWVAKLLRCEDPQLTPAPAHVHSTYRWIMEGTTCLGAIELRHAIDHPLLREAGGHIGYNVRPGHRGRGIATWALGETLQQARSMGMDRVLLTCSPENTASARIIEKAGGVLEDVRETSIGPKRRYWITL
ncbi:GNAT family N-acetyltransferase [Dactylosporangium sp. NPDC049140]|uniref:GNAT family N-acetyltransferase n=1 Tax=Dactylosporangium sp. NPDC049140 TaxID=3155647 RepID=UPI0033C93AD2